MVIETYGQPGEHFLKVGEVIYGPFLTEIALARRANRLGVFFDALNPVTVPVPGSMQHHTTWRKR